MYTTLHKLLHLPVFTESGARLGKVHDVKIDVEAHSVKQYLVHAGLLSKDEYLIGPAQVVSITEEKMIVDDTISKDTSGEAMPVKDTASKPALGGVMPAMNEIEKLGN